MQIIVNGETKDVSPDQSLHDIIESLGLNPKAVVAQVNDDILERKTYQEVLLTEGDNLELIHFVGGG
jgi:thiamine biosynthesis protein ThiS